jgi:hypothetical protein
MAHQPDLSYIFACWSYVMFTHIAMVDTVQTPTRPVPWCFACTVRTNFVHRGQGPQIMMIDIDFYGSDFGLHADMHDRQASYRQKR